MNKYWFFFLLVVLVMGCQPQNVEVTGTPTATIPPLAGDPIPVDLSALAANPTIYENTYIQLTGQYTKQPRLVCESNPHRSPVTWGLSSTTLLALAGGFDEQLRPLLPQGLTMTVAGRWQHWQGNVGCGEVVQPQDLWYLQVTEIISPSPLTQVTLTPGGIPIAQIGDTPAADAPPIVDGTVSPVEEGTAVIPTQQPPISAPTEPGVQTTAVPTTPSGVRPTTTTPDPRFSPTPTNQFVANTATPGGTASATATSGRPGTTTPTTTPLAGATPTTGPTPTRGSLTTSTPAPAPIDMGQIDPETLIMDFINSNESHLWTFDNEIPNNNLNIQVAPSAQADFTITVYDSNGVPIASQNNTGTGIIETITGLNLPSEGTYDIVLTDNNNAVSDYAIIVLDDLSFNISFHQIDYGVSQTTSFTEEEEQIWFFDASEDDMLTITAVPTTGTPDIGFELIDPTADTLEYIDEWFESSDPEVLSDYILADTGLHGVWLFGTDSGTMSIRLSVNN
jgi:hypothetical protein